jgi:hypothetical protein
MQSKGIGMNETHEPRRKFQYSLRLLCLVMLLACIGMSWVSVKMQRARRQKEVVEEIKELGGSVTYDYEVDAAGHGVPGEKLLSPKLLRSLLGDDFFTNVVHVDFRSNQNMDARQVTDAGLEHLNLKRLAQLHILWLNGSQVTDAGLEHLKGLTQLRGLSLSSTQVTDAGMEKLKGLAQLQYLSLDSTQVTDAGLEHLKGLTQLEDLFLDSTKVTDIGLDHLKGLTKLRSLWFITLSLDSTKVTDEGVKRLQQALPNCQITR